MRTLILVGSALLAVPCFADTVLDTGQLRDAKIAAPTVGTVATTGTMIDLGPQSEDPAASRKPSDQPVSGVDVQELAARQLRRYQRAIDTCLVPLRKKAPATSGSLALVLRVVDHKVGDVKIADDSLGNAQLNACLTKSARTWSFSLPDSELSKVVSLAPQASR